MGKKCIVLKNFINTEYLLSIADEYEATASKVGKVVDFNKKRRTDQVLNEEQRSYIDKQIFRKCKKTILDYFNIYVNFREPWKIGFYSHKDEGFYNPHTDMQGNYYHRRISMSICLSDKNEYTGGILQFSKLKKAIKLDRGDVCFFNSSLLHEVTPVTEGLRKVLIGFFFIKLPHGPSFKDPDMYKPDGVIKSTMDNRYLLPLPPDSGPGNQIMSIKEALVIAYFLNRQVIFPPIRQHYTKSEKYWGFSEIYQYDAINIMEYYDYKISSADISRSQWSCSSIYNDKLLKTQKFLCLEDIKTEPITIKQFETVYDFNCELNHFQSGCMILKHPFNTVKLQSQDVNGIFNDPYNPYFKGVYEQICKKLDFSQSIKQQAKLFMQHVGISKNPYIAIHLRYPDSLKAKSNLKDYSGFSENDLDNAIFRKFGKYYAPNRVFIATNNQPLAKNSPLGKYVFYNDDNNPKASFIEQLICANAETFILSTTNDFKDSKRSTWSSFVVDYRTFKLNIEARNNVTLKSILL